MVKFFKSYTLEAAEESDIEGGVADSDRIEVNKLMQEFNPSKDRIDAIILCMLTGEDDGHIMQNWLFKNEETDPGDIF